MIQQVVTSVPFSPLVNFTEHLIQLGARTFWSFCTVVDTSSKLKILVLSAKLGGICIIVCKLSKNLPILDRLNAVALAKLQRSGHLKVRLGCLFRKDRNYSTPASLSRTDNSDIRLLLYFTI